MLIRPHQLNDLSQIVLSDTDVICIDISTPKTSTSELTHFDLAISGLTQYPQHRDRFALKIDRLNAQSPRNNYAGLKNIAHLPGYILVSGAEEPEEVATLAKHIARYDCKLILLIETPLGVAKARTLVTAHSTVAALVFGGAEYASFLGISMSWEGMLHARQELVFSAALTNIPAIDVAAPIGIDADDLAIESNRARAIGFQGKVARNLSQVDVINHCFSPSDAEIRAAKSTIAAFEDHFSDPLDNALAAPLLTRYYRVLDAARRIQNKKR